MQFSRPAELYALSDITSRQIATARSSYLHTPESRAIPTSFGFEMLPTPLRANFKLLIIPIRDGFSRLAFSSTAAFIDRAMTTVYWIFRDFLSPVLPSPLSRARRVGVGWKPPRTTEVLIEFIAMLFMRDRERARGTEREREREREKERARGGGRRERRTTRGARGEKGERETREDSGGKREPYISTSRIGVAVVLVSNIPVSRECRKANPPHPEDCRNVRAKSAARCM